MAGVAPAAQAKTTDRGTQLLKQIVTSEDKAGALAQLTPADLALVKQAFQKNLVITTDPAKSISGKLPGASKQALGLSPATVSAMASGGCWYDYEYSTATLLGITVGHFWMQLNWCGNGSSITSYNVSPYGASGQNGFSASTSSPQFRNVGWEVRAVGVFTFTTWQGLSSSICGQIRGGASGLYSAFIGCKM